jgi:tripartite-type tricarboxylate transporter receptor subunit TctC
MPGAGGTKMANYMYNAAHRDGLTIGTPLAPVPITQLLRPNGVKYDAAKFQWIGNLEGSPPVLAVWHTAPVQSVEQAKTKQLIVASSGKSSVTYQVPAMINRLLGTKIKIVTGYKGETDIDLAIERGEVQGRSSFYGSMIVSKPQAIKDGRLRIIAQVSTHEVPALKDVPNLVTTARDADARRMFEFFALQSATGRAYFTPPGVPADRVAMLRKAFDDTAASHEFDADMKTRHMLYDATPGVEVQQAVAKMLTTPKPIVDRVREAIGF